MLADLGNAPVHGEGDALQPRCAYKEGAVVGRKPGFHLGSYKTELHALEPGSDELRGEKNR